jgi:L-threonylcarbamoyladenylate synthase
LITDPYFYAVAVPAVILLGVSKSGFGAGFGSLAVPMMALAVTVPEAAAILMPLLFVMDVLGMAAFRKDFDLALLRHILPFGVLGVSAPSANRFGRVSPTTAAHVQSELGPDLLILDGGECDVGIESTIIDCTRGEPVLLRPGQITRTQIEAACGRAVLDKDTPQEVLGQSAPRASGTLESHYAPRAKVRLMSAADIAHKLQALGPHANNLGLWSAERPKNEVGLGAGVLWRQQATTAEQAAHDLFSVLRDLVARGVTQIWVQLPPDTPDWEGVRDRLQRAAA